MAFGVGIWPSICQACEDFHVTAHLVEFNNTFTSRLYWDFMMFEQITDDIIDITTHHLESIYA